MYKRLPYLVACLIFFSPFLLASPPGQQQAAPIGIEVQSWHYDVPEGTNPSNLVITLVNTSHKNIMAWSMTDDIAYANGMHDKGERSQDLLGSKDIFAPGSTRNIELSGVPPVLSVSAVPDVVIYDDKTADVRNDRAFERLMRYRNERLLAFQKANEIIKQFPGNNEAVATELERLVSLSTTRKSQTEVVPNGGVLQMLAREVQQSSDLNQLVKENDDHIAAILPHTKVVKEVQP